MSKLLILILLISYTLSLTFGALLPKQRKVEEIQKTLANKEVVLETRGQYVAQLKEYSSRIDEREEEIEKMNYALPSRSDVSYLLEFLNEALSDSGIVFRGVGGLSTTRAGKKEETGRVEISLNLTGTYDSLLSFLERTEKTARLIEVDSLSVAKEKSRVEGEEEESEGPSLFTFHVTLSAPYFPSSKEE